MTRSQILIFWLISDVIFSSLGEEKKVDFCEKNPDLLICARDSQCALDDDCGETTKPTVGFGPELRDLRKTIVTDINELRKNLVNGKVSFKGQNLPTAGDMVEVEWNYKLEKTAQNYVKRCTTQHSPVKSRIFENVTDVSEYINMNANTNSMSDEEFWQESLKTWQDIELGIILPYAKGQKVYNPRTFVLILFGKQRYVGCGWLSFHEETNDVWTRYVVCHFAPAGLENNKFYAVNTNACKACPKKTKCSKKGPNQGVLCAWSGVTSKMQVSSSLPAILSIICAWVCSTILH